MQLELGDTVPGALDPTTPDFRAWAENLAPRNCRLPGWRLVEIIHSRVPAPTPYLSEWAPVRTHLFAPAGAPRRPRLPTCDSVVDGPYAVSVDPGSGYAGFYAAAVAQYGSFAVSTMDDWGPSHEEAHPEGVITEYLRAARERRARSVRDLARVEELSRSIIAEHRAAVVAWTAGLPVSA